MVAYHFPPCGEVSGTLRTLSMARGLRKAGWEPVILAPSLMAYPSRDSTLASEAEFQSAIFRALALDAKQHLGLMGRYPERLALPDRWASWRLAAIPLGVRLIRRYRPKAIWSTFPIATAHNIARVLRHRMRLPWIADFRDPMFMHEGNLGRLTTISRERVERRVVADADACVFVTQSLMAAYEQRYQNSKQGIFELIPNGYDDGLIQCRARSHDAATPVVHEGKPIKLLHSGALYTDGRCPEPFLHALGSLKSQGLVSSTTLRIVFRVSGTEGVSTRYATQLARYDIGDMVEFAPSIDHKSAVNEQITADGLLVLQGPQFNLQIPAKTYEYLALGKPIFALTDPAGETAQFFSDKNISIVADINNTSEIEARLLEFINEIGSQRFTPLQGSELRRYARSTGAQELAHLVDRVTSK